MTGKIIKGIAGFYYVQTGQGLYECKARGVFRNKSIKPLVGDNVELEVTDEQEKKATIIRLLDRRNELIRPAVANVDQAIVVFALKNPEPNFNLLDRFLLMMETKQIQTMICFNKSDLDYSDEVKEQMEEYKQAGYQLEMVCMHTGEGIERIRKHIHGKTTVLAGPSGVGKSSMLNCLCGQDHMDTGEVSQKIGRGKHTTRHSELFALGEDTYVLDTPGFTSLMVMDLEPEEIRFYYPEFEAYEGKCRFQGCVHIHEPGCAVKDALAEHKLGIHRYDNYCRFFEEQKQKPRKK